jgi:zinc/manganese transport system substrate-binding protein
MQPTVSSICRVALPLLLGLLIGCDRPAPDAAPAASTLHAIATTSIIADWVRCVGGDHVQITSLVGPDGDPHEYEPVPGDAVVLSQSNLIFANGLGLETWLDKLYSSSQTKAPLIELARGVDPIITTAGEIDPHVWQDVTDAMVMVGNIRDALCRADPSHASQYQRNAAAYSQQLGDLDKWVRDQINSLPPTRRTLVTSHDAFGYFGRRYGMDVSRSALESVTSEASDPSAQQIAQVVSAIKSTGVPAIFLENIQNPHLIQQLAEDAQVKVAPSLYSDALGAAGSDGETYIKMIRHNVNTIVKALSTP